MNKQNLKLYFKYFVKSLLFTLAIGLLIFSLLSGAEDSGFWKNIPNSLPWIILTVCICITFWRAILGSLLVILFGLSSVMFFSSQIVLYAISIPIIVSGIILFLIDFNMEFLKYRHRLRRID